MPHLGSDEERVSSLGTHVIMTLMAPYLRRGHNVTTDNFFTTLDLAEKLADERTSLVGTIRQNRRELPNLEKQDLHKSHFFQSGRTTLVTYQAKRAKSVSLVSTLHRGTKLENSTKKKLEIIVYYNENKCGVDMLDSMYRQLSTKSGSRR